MLTLFLSVIETDADKNRLIDLFERHSSLIERRAAFLAIGHRYNAEELMQETWLRVSKQVDHLQFPSEKAERVYLLAALRSCANDFWRKEKKRRTVEVPLEDADAWPLADADTEELVQSKITEEQARSIARTLSQSDREILSMILFVGLSMEEASAALGITRSAAEKRYARAKVRLAKKIREAGLIDV